MRLLVLGPYRPDIISFLSSFGDEVVSVEDRIVRSSSILTGVDFLISYGYRFILKQEVLDLFPQKAINLHISLLPWNRGADPNLWSFLLDTPKGVTIHLLDNGIDTGDILAQQYVEMDSDDTLRSSYNKLMNAMDELFYSTWPKIRSREITPIPQLPGGNFHRLADKEPFEHFLICGWDTPVSSLVGRANVGKNEV